MGKGNAVFFSLRIPAELMKRIKEQQRKERRGNRSEMVRVLIEDGLKARQEKEK